MAILPWSFLFYFIGTLVGVTKVDSIQTVVPIERLFGDESRQKPMGSILGDKPKYNVMLERVFRGICDIALF